MPRKPLLRVRKLGKDYWISGNQLEEDLGPYLTKKEAEEDRISLEKTIRANRDIFPREED